MTANTIFLRLEGPLQSWGDNQSKFVIRRTAEAPTKSGILGLICCAMELSRADARKTLPKLNQLAMGVRIDRPGTRWWDYHTVGAGIGLLTAEGKLKTGAQGTLISRREYLCDASFLVVLQGEPTTIGDVAHALQSPKWPLYLGRKCCPPATPVYVETSDKAEDLLAQLRSQSWRPRYTKGKSAVQTIRLECLIEWPPCEDQIAPADAEVWYDAPLSFAPPVHGPRLVRRQLVEAAVDKPIQYRTPPPPRPRADYQNAKYKKQRESRLERDYNLCIFCKNPASTVQHITYRRAGGGEMLDDLRSLCRLCHDAVTMIEYGLGMGLDRINPEVPRWRDPIIQKRQEIIQWRSLETRQRRLSPEEV